MKNSPAEKRQKRYLGYKGHPEHMYGAGKNRGLLWEAQASPEGIGEHGHDSVLKR